MTSVSVSERKWYHFFEQVFLQFHVVFNDPVVDDDEIAIFIRMRMGIDVRRAAVRCPAGVTDAGRPGNGMFLDFFRQVCQPARFLRIAIAPS